jgi:TonB family protein
LWIAGATVAAGLLLWRQARYMAAIARREAGPAVVGALRPRIVIPADFEARFDASEREVILAHEHAHLRAGDARINALAAASLCACWFNPLVHLAVYLMRLDQELACDAAVLGAFPKARRLYAEVLLKTQLATQPLPFGCHWPAAAEHPLKERIVMLKSPLPAPARRFAGVAVVALLSAAGAAAAWAAQPGQPRPAALVEAVAAAPASPAETGTRRDAAAVAETPHTLTQAEARRQAGPGDEVLCKPGTDWTKANCRILHGKTFTQIATAADIAAEYPAAARQAGLTARVMLQCAPNAGTRSLEACQAIRVAPIDGPAPPSSMNSAFEQAAIRVAGKYRLASPPPEPLGPQFFITVDFSAHPILAGGPPTDSPSKSDVALAVLPDWIARPDMADVVRFYPPAAAAAKQEGRATITCRVDGQGRLGKCQMISEAPEGAGFGDAALALADRFQMKPLDKEGRPTAGQDVRIPFKFALPQAGT